MARRPKGGGRRRGESHLIEAPRYRETQELDGCAEGLFGKGQSLELPERAHCPLDALSGLRAIFDGLYERAVIRQSP